METLSCPAEFFYPAANLAYGVDVILILSGSFHAGMEACNANFANFAD